MGLPEPRVRFFKGCSARFDIKQIFLQKIGI